jgi:hypothetical protein
MSLVVLRSLPKWLNIVLDINGILCHCVEQATTKRMPLVNDVKLEILLSMVPTIIKPKGVFKHPGLSEFLIAISKFAAHVVIWNSMKRSTVEIIVGYLFRCIPRPFDVG